MDKRLVGMSTVDEVVPHWLVHPRARVRRVSVVPYYNGNEDSYVDYLINKAQEDFCIAHNSVTSI